MLSISTYEKFLFQVLSLITAITLLVMSFNYFMDPYSIWNVKRYVGINMWTMKPEHVERMGKPIALFSAEPKPEIVFVGSSQVDWGIDAGEASRLLGRSVYNFGILGMTAYEQRRYVEHILVADPAVKEIVLAADITKFVSGARYKTAFDEPVKSEEHQLGRNYVSPENIEKTLLSLKVLKDSIASLKENRKRRWQTSYYLDGKTISDEGMWNFFDREHWRFDRSLAQVQREGWLEDLYFNEDCFAEYEKIAALCKEKGIGLKIYIPAEHAEAMMAYMDCLDLYGQWMKRLAEIAPLWTFFEINDISKSPVREGWLSAETNAYFWDSVHHKKNVGTWTVAALYGVETDGMPQEFGRRIMPEETDVYLQRLRKGLEEWQQTHPHEAEIARYYAGFSAVRPTALAGLQDSGEQAVTNIQAGSVETQAHFTLRGQDYLEFRGATLFPLQQIGRAYITLTNAEGKVWYSFAESVLSDESANFMHNREYDKAGFRVQESLTGIPAGDYDIRWVGVSSEKMIITSAVLGKVTVTE